MSFSKSKAGRHRAALGITCKEMADEMRHRGCLRTTQQRLYRLERGQTKWTEGERTAWLEIMAEAQEKTSGKLLDALTECW